VFIRAVKGEEVHAVAAGLVVFAEWMRGFGNLMILDHGRSYLTIYSNGTAQTGGRFGQDRRCRGRGRQ
jgi:septal ring factor EnvC (AmiA/AmiB activator)